MTDIGGKMTRVEVVDEGKRVGEAGGVWHYSITI